MYGKVFSQIFDGTLHGRTEATATFMALIAIADSDGVVDLTLTALTSRTGWPQEFIQKGIEELELIDEASRTPDEDGRRIVRLRENTSWGWRIVNYQKYRAIRNETERQEYMRNYMRNYRRRSLPSEVCVYCAAPCNGVDHIVPLALGGSDEIENKAPCCDVCNKSKKAYTIPYWLFKSELVQSNASPNVALSNRKVYAVFTRQLINEHDANLVNVCKRFVNQCKPPLAQGEVEEEEEVNKDLSPSPSLSLKSKDREPPLPLSLSLKSRDSVCGASSAPPCPHDEIIKLYHSILPMGTVVKIWGNERKARLRARWREDSDRQNLEWWRGLFSYIASSSFLTGKVEPINGRTPFVLSLDWIVRPRNFININEGKYNK